MSKLTKFVCTISISLFVATIATTGKDQRYPDYQINLVSAQGTVPEYLVLGSRIAEAFFKASEALSTRTGRHPIDFDEVYITQTASEISVAFIVGKIPIPGEVLKSHKSVQFIFQKKDFAMSERNPEL